MHGRSMIEMCGGKQDPMTITWKYPRGREWVVHHETAGSESGVLCSHNF